MEISSDTVQALAIGWGIKLGAAIAIFIIGRLLAYWVSGLVAKMMNRAEADPILVGFVKNMTYAAAITFVILAAIAQLGIQTTSFIAVLGAAGLAIGLALQGSLSNFAAGVMMVIFRPFKVGDFVEAGGTSGIVEEIMIFSTKMRTGDNREVIVPNGAIINGTITNYSARDTRRVDAVVAVSYNDDLKKVRAVLEDILSQDDRVLKDPEPTIGVSELADNSVNFVVRPWVNSADYWAVLFDFNETVKTRFDAEGISIPYPRRDVHIHQAAA